MDTDINQTPLDPYPDHYSEEDAYVDDPRQTTGTDEGLIDHDNESTNDDVRETKRKHRATDIRGTRLSYYTELNNDEVIPVVELADARHAKYVEKLKKHRIDQLLALIASCFLTHALVNERDVDMDLNLVQAIVVTTGSTTFPPQAASVGAGVFLGLASNKVIPNYGWLCLLTAVQSIVWLSFIHFNLLVGFGGRLGVTAFVSTNITLAVFIMPSKAVPWSFYGSSERLWSDVLHLKSSAVTVGACLLDSIVTGYIRVNANEPLNPVMIGSQLSLILMLTVLPTKWEYTSSWNAGVAVGSFLSMASVEYLPRVADFAIAGFIAGFWKLFLDPFFIGFGGKGGFTAFCAFVTYIGLKKLSMGLCKQMMDPKTA